MNRFVALTFCLGLPAIAFAWNPLSPRIAWFIEDQPIPFEIADYEEDSLPPGTSEQVILDSWASWDIAECAQMNLRYDGLSADNTGFKRGDGINRVNWDDPEDELAVGVLAAATPYSNNPNNPTRLILGETYGRITDGDVVMNNGVDWATEEDIETGNCIGEYSVVAVMTHEAGHWWGLGHTCEEDDACTDPSDRNATMFWSVGPCDNNPAVPSQNDVDGVTALYGPSTQIRCSHELDPGTETTVAVGVAPMEIRCVVTERGNETFTVDDASWYFGDGTENEVGLEVVHTYTEAGNYSIQANVVGTSDACGEWDVTVKRDAYVRVCGVPDVDLDVQHIDGRRFKLLNQTDLSVIGCIYAVQWDIFDESGALVTSLGTSEPDYEFPANGQYRLVLNVGGPAGTAARELFVNIRNVRGEGYSTCSSVNPMTLGAFALVLPLAMRRRRQ